MKFDSDIKISKIIKTYNRWSLWCSLIFLAVPWFRLFWVQMRQRSFRFVRLVPSLIFRSPFSNLWPKCRISIYCQKCRSHLPDSWSVHGFWTPKCLLFWFRIHVLVRVWFPRWGCFESWSRSFICHKLPLKLSSFLGVFQLGGVLCGCRWFQWSLAARFCKLRT